MICKVSLIIPLAFVLQAHIVEVVAIHTGSTHESMGKLLGKLDDKSDDKLFEWAFKVWPLRGYTRLDSATLGKLSTTKFHSTPYTRSPLASNPFLHDALISRSKSRSANIVNEPKLEQLDAPVRTDRCVAEECIRRSLAVPAAVELVKSQAPRVAETAELSGVELRGARAQQEAQQQQLRRRVVTLGVAAHAAAVAFRPLSEHARAAEGTPTTVAMTELNFKNFRLQVPTQFEEADMKSSTLVLLRDSRPGLAGNTITISKQLVPEGGPKSMSDLGPAEDIGAKLVATEKQRGVKGVELQSARAREDSTEQLFYQVDYKKNVFGVPRRVLMSLTVAGGMLYTLTVEVDSKRYDSEEGDALRRTATSFAVNPRSD